jgi:hypothetical protein
MPLPPPLYFHWINLLASQLDTKTFSDVLPLGQILEESSHLFILDILLKSPIANLSIELSLPEHHNQHIEVN